MCGICAFPLCSKTFIFLLYLGVSQGFRGPSLEFSSYKLIRPTLHHARTKREISSTKHTSGVHEPEVTLALEMEGERRELELRLNTGLIADRHVLHYQQGGKTLVHKPTKQELELCQYWGKVRGSPGSWAAVSTCRGVRGVIHDGTTTRYIEPANDAGIQSPHYLYDHADLNTRHDPLLQNHAGRESNRSQAIRNKRSAEDSSIYSPYNADRNSRYVELVLVADHATYVASGGSLGAVHSKMKDLANILNSMYASLNIFIALVGVVVWTAGDLIDMNGKSDNVLDNFLEYRQTELNNKILNDNAHLIISRYKHFKEVNDRGKMVYVIGKAPVERICTSESSGGIATYSSQVLGLLAGTIAHEMGHNFGMDHDTEKCSCPSKQCIMSHTSASVTPTHWSSCSRKALDLTIKRGLDHCLLNKPKSLFKTPTCGNGFVEAGEQCDCGLVWGEEHTACTACCHPHTCMLRANATCGAGACCDLQTCRPRAAGALCRAAERECDLPEYCSGHSEFCPRDVFKMDSTPCGTEQQAYCVRGSCRSHSDQCRLLWGSTGETSHDKCYTTNNVQGEWYGHCGYGREWGSDPKKCREEDARCGLVQCRHSAQELAFGNNIYSSKTGKVRISYGSIKATCYTASVNMDSDVAVDPGLVPDGAKCGNEKMCLKQRCVAVAAVRDEIARRYNSVCPSNCSGHGVCNSEGHCHCERGFAPPLCSEPGPGGSINSGPAADPLVHRNFMVAMYVIFLGIVPAVVLVLVLFYYLRRRDHSWWQKITNLDIHAVFASLKSRSSAESANDIKLADSQKQKNVPTISGPIDTQNQTTNLYIQEVITTKQLNRINKGDICIVSKSDIVTNKQTLTNRPVNAINTKVTDDIRIASCSRNIATNLQRSTNKPVNEINIKVNKNDERILSNADIDKAQCPRPPIKSKPQVPRGSKPSFGTAVPTGCTRQGFASTTHEILGSTSHIHKVHDKIKMFENIKVHDLKKYNV